MVAASVNGTIAHIVPILTDRGISPAMATSLLSVTGNRADRRENPERIFPRSLFRALRGGLLLFPATYRHRTPEQRRGRNRSAARHGLPGTWTSDRKSTSWRLWSGRYFGVRTFGEIYGYIMGVFVFASGLGPTIMGVCYDRTHSYNLALEGFAVALALASIFISRLGPYAFPAPKRMAMAPAASAALSD